MSTVEEIEAALRRMSADERARFGAWYAEFDAEEWDRQLEQDAVAGRLDWLVSEALAEKRPGRTTEL